MLFFHRKSPPPNSLVRPSLSPWILDASQLAPFTPHPYTDPDSRCHRSPSLFIPSIVLSMEKGFSGIFNSVCCVPSSSDHPCPKPEIVPPFRPMVLPLRKTLHAPNYCLGNSPSSSACRYIFLLTYGFFSILFFPWCFFLPFFHFF